jgi:hypothetical protein
MLLETSSGPTSSLGDCHHASYIYIYIYIISCPLKKLLVVKHALRERERERERGV